jgi:UDP-N-acetylglucosamine:LPS N-acetylglucosamine transferase
MTRVLAAASAGGHWEQMMLMRDMLDQHEVAFATTNPDLPVRAGITNATILPDCNRDQILDSLRCLIAAARLVLRFRPQVVISTGAAPGFFCIIFGRLIGARTLWIDSVANAEQLSMCGKLSRHFSTRCITQWEHLSADGKPGYAGNLL